MRFVTGSVLAIAAATAWCEPPERRRPDFTHDILPILQRQGCASAYCHGSATGRAGFKLSLFGGDPAADHAAIAAQFGGRRIDRREPAASLLVQKALGRLDHGGGRRVARDGEAHRALLDWIGAGAPFRSGPAAALVGLELARVGGRLAARATFHGEPGGEIRDVTALAMFTSTDPTVVEVDAEGALTWRGPGLAHLSARYGNQTALLRVVRPFGSPPAAPALSSGHPLDDAWFGHLAELGLPAAASVAPPRLARRLHLDLLGRPPTPRELDEFVANPDAGATARRLAARPEFAAVFGGHLARWFEVPDEAARGGPDPGRLRDAFTASLARGDSLPRIAQRVVDGDLGMLQRLSDPRDRGEYMGRTLLGVRIGCARCHDHPLDRWRQAEHLAWSACFAPPRPDGEGGMAAGVLFDPGSGEPVPPRLPALGSRAAEALQGDRPAALRAFVLDRAHDQFARSLANRVFAELIGQGLVEPPDDHRLGNPPLSAAMLAALTGEFHRTGGRLQDLAVFVASSAVYAADCAEADGPEQRLLAARASLPLRPDAYVRAVAAVVEGGDPAPLPRTPLARELAMQNGRELPSMLAAGGTTIDAIFEISAGPAERLRDLWRTVLSRAPRADELQRFLPLAAGDLAAFRDLALALLTGREFGHRR